MEQIISSKSTVAIKWAVGILLVLVAIVAVAVGGLREARRAAEASVPTAAATPAALSGVATVYYFHGETRCETCLTIERQTAELVRGRFASEIASGRLQFQAVNYDTPENRRFRDTYDLSFGSVVVTDGTRWENLSDVWKLVHDDRTGFDAYLTEHIMPFVGATP